MKFQIYISIFCLSFLFSVSGYSQAKKAENRPDLDPKLSLKEQLAILEASKGTPAKVEVETDPRMIEEYGFDIVKETGPTRYDAEPAVEREPVDPPQTIIATGTSATGKSENATQPEPQQAENIMNYRNINGGNQQPEPEKSVNVINYRKISGPQEQPDGNKENK